MSIHPTAVISPKAEIESDVEIGPYVCISDHVKLESGNVLQHHVTITGHTTIGRNNHFYPGAIIGTPPQDLKFEGEVTGLEIGEENTFREYVTVNLGTELGGGKTKIGSNNLIMTGSHIAHDCVIKDNAILANLAMLGGHVKVDKYAIFGGLVGVHHFVSIGEYAFIGGMSRINQDIPPFMMIEGNPSRVRGVNIVGLKRNGFSSERIDAIKFAHRMLYRKERTSMSQAINELEKSEFFTDDVKYLVQFLRNSEKGKYGRALEASRQD